MNPLLSITGSPDPVEENRELRRLISILSHKAERNETLLQNFFAAELNLLSCTTFAELVHYLLHDFRIAFNLNEVSLQLLDPEGMAQELLDGSVTSFAHQPQLHLLTEPERLQRIHPDMALYCGEPSPLLQTLCFSGEQPINSCAVLPLIRENCLIGSFSLGSCDPERYSPLLRYDYVSHLAAMISLSIENCISRETLFRLSNYDTLTRVLNRRAFNQQLMREIKRCNRSGENLCCVLMDIDHFKQINDRYGHLTGDSLLRGVAQLLRDELRDTDTIARYGGEEFALLLPGCDAEAGMQVAEQLRQRLQEHTFHGYDDIPIHITASFGLTLYSSRDELAADITPLCEALVHSADQALYASKHGGRNRTGFHACPVTG